MDDKDKLVTLAIHSFEKAQALQFELAANGIDSIIQHVGDTIVTRNVRVRVKESDLDKATTIVEEIKQNEDVKAAMDEICHKGFILVPVDFSDFSLRICSVAFKLAQRYNTRIEILHSFIDPTPHINLLEEMLTREKGKRDQALQEEIDKANQKKNEFDLKLKEKIASGEFPNVNYKYVIKMGIPEEAILEYSDREKPQLIMMGSRSQVELEREEMGNVTAEVLERSHIPVFALPTKSNFESFDNIKNLVYATRFEDEDLIAFDKLMTMLSPFKFRIHFLHLQKGKQHESETSEAWNEIKLRGIKDYFMKHYPDQEFIINLMENNGSIPSIANYVEKEQIDIISLTTHQRSLFVRLFNPSTAKTMLGISNTPLLVFNI